MKENNNNNDSSTTFSRFVSCDNVKKMRVCTNLNNGMVHVCIPMQNQPHTITTVTLEANNTVAFHYLSLFGTNAVEPIYTFNM